MYIISYQRYCCISYHQCSGCCHNCYYCCYYSYDSYCHGCGLQSQQKSQQKRNIATITYTTKTSNVHQTSLLTDVIPRIFFSQSLVQSGLNESGRGMELSDLCWFYHHLLAFDDRTGTLFSLQNSLPIPYLALTESPRSVKGMKIEWASVKDDTLYVGSIGKPWTTRDGEYINDYPQHVWIVSRDKNTTYVDWKHVYDTVKKAVGIGNEGYAYHSFHGIASFTCGDSAEHITHPNN